jgi:hypothetical protein
VPAHADLDGDGASSTFFMQGAVKTDSKGKKAAVLAPNIGEINPEE